MNTSPTIDDLLAGVIQALDQDVLPALADPKAQATAAMAQSLLQTVRQLLPVYDQALVEEHNDMIRMYVDTMAALDGVEGEPVDRIAAVAAAATTRDPFPMPPDRAEVMAGHRELSSGMAEVLYALDELQRAGVTQADEALEVVRGHLAPRYLRVAATVTVEGGMLGRG